MRADMRIPGAPSSERRGDAPTLPGDSIDEGATPSPHGGDEQAEQHIAAAVDVFRLLADPTRMTIVLALEDSERSVNELAGLARKSPAAVSQHLAKLRWGRIVRTRHEGTRVFYSLVDEHALTLVRHALYQAEHVLDAAPAHHAGA